MKPTKEQKLETKKKLSQLSNFLESEAGKNLLANIKRQIRANLIALLDVIEEKEPELKAKFYLTCAKLKSELQMYKDLTGVKKELTIIEESLEDEEMV